MAKELGVGWINLFSYIKSVLTIEPVSDDSVCDWDHGSPFFFVKVSHLDFNSICVGKKTVRITSNPIAPKIFQDKVLRVNVWVVKVARKSCLWINEWISDTEFSPFSHTVSRYLKFHSFVFTILKISLVCWKIGNICISNNLIKQILLKSPPWYYFVSVIKKCVLALVLSRWDCSDTNLRLKLDSIGEKDRNSDGNAATEK